MRRRSAVFVLVAMSAASLVAGQTEPVPFVVGVWSYDAVIPFADFDGRRWRSSWPEPLDTSDSGLPRPPTIPTIPRLSGIPPAWWGSSQFQPDWELIERGGRRRMIQVTGTRLASYGSSCTANIGLRTNLRDDTYSQLQLVTNRPGVVEPITVLRPGTPDWRIIVALLPGLYRGHDTPVRPIPNDVRPDLSALSASPTLETAFMSSDASGQFVYFQALRVRTDQPGDRSMAGWLWRRSPQSSWQLVTSEIVARNDYGSGTFTPLGFVSDGTRVFWLGIKDISLTVLDVRRAGVKPLVKVGMGLC